MFICFVRLSRLTGYAACVYCQGVNLPGRRNLSQLVADSLLEEIRSGRIQPGDRLPTERGLMEHYGVGRSAVREAIQSLLAMRILDVRPGRGATVIGINPDDALDPATISALLERPTLEDLYDFRELLEAEAGARAATAATPEAFADIERAYRNLRDAVVAHHSSYRADLDFHRAIVAASGNAIFLRVLDAVADLLSSARLQTERVPGAVGRALAEHEGIFRAIERGDAAAARRLSIEHIASGKAALAEARALSPRGPFLAHSSRLSRTSERAPVR